MSFLSSFKKLVGINDVYKSHVNDRDLQVTLVHQWRTTGHNFIHLTLLSLISCRVIALDHCIIHQLWLMILTIKLRPLDLIKTESYDCLFSLGLPIYSSVWLSLTRSASLFYQIWSSWFGNDFEISVPSAHNHLFTLFDWISASTVSALFISFLPYHPFLLFFIWFLTFFWLVLSSRVIWLRLTKGQWRFGIWAASKCSINLILTVKLPVWPTPLLLLFYMWD